jgi:hypothetical protein
MKCVPSPQVDSRKIYSWLLPCLLPLVFLLPSCGSNPNANSASSVVSAEELAKTITDPEIKNYAKAVVAIEQLRKTTNQEMTKVSEGKPFDEVVCTQQETIASLPTKMQEVAIVFCTKVRKLSEDNGLTIPRFNAITVNAKNNPDLQKKINDQLITLQK